MWRACGPARATPSPPGGTGGTFVENGAVAGGRRGRRGLRAGRRRACDAAKPVAIDQDRSRISIRTAADGSTRAAARALRHAGRASPWRRPPARTVAGAARCRTRHHLGSKHVRSIDVGRVSVAGRSGHQRQRAADGVAAQHQSRRVRDMGIALLAGRDFTVADTLETPLVAIISEAAAARFGRGRIRRTPAADRHGREYAVDDDRRRRGRCPSSGAVPIQPGRRRLRAPARHLSSLCSAAQCPCDAGIRTAGEPETQINAVRAAIAGVDPSVPIYDVASLESRMRGEEAPLAFATLLINLYGGLAILLAGSVSTACWRRVSPASPGNWHSPALGADPRRLVTNVMWQGLSISLASTVIGMAVAGRCYGHSAECCSASPAERRDAIGRCRHPDRDGHARSLIPGGAPRVSIRLKLDVQLTIVNRQQSRNYSIANSAITSKRQRASISPPLLRHEGAARATLIASAISARPVAPATGVASTAHEPAPHRIEAVAHIAWHAIARLTCVAARPE